MRLSPTILLALLLTQGMFAQSSLIDETISKIEISQDTLKSVYDWIAENIAYDINKINKIKKGTAYNKNWNFKSEEEYQNYLLERVIQQRKGVCEDYSLLFDAIVKQLGYESYIIEGYTKSNDGKISRSIGHTWNAVKDGSWKLYDPTWGAGYVEDDRRFVKNYNQAWFDVSPEDMIKTHMPFDPVCQLLGNPVKYEEFEDDFEAGGSDGNYNYGELIENHINKGKKEQMNDQLNRSKAMGDGKWLVSNYRRRMSKNISLYGISSQQDLLEETNEKANNSVELFNHYIKAKNKRFQGKKWTIDNARQDLETAREHASAVLEVYKSIEVEDRGIQASLRTSIFNLERMLKRIEAEIKFMEELN